MKHIIFFLVMCIALTSCANPTPKSNPGIQSGSWIESEMVAKSHNPEVELSRVLKSENKVTAMLAWIKISRD